LRPGLWYFTIGVLGSSGLINGTVVVKILKMFSTTSDWKATTILSALFFPFLAVSSIFLIDFFEWTESADEEFNTKTTLGSLAVWLIVDLPSTFVGAMLTMTLDDNIKMNRNTIPRHIPDD
jgi:hypothetical protein